MTVDVTYYFKDPSKLTPYEEKLLEMRNNGMTYAEISKSLDGSCKPTTIASRFTIIREKLKIIEALARETSK